MDVIYKFTNSKGLSNFGIVTEYCGNGAYVLMDQNRYQPARHVYISFEPNPFVMGNNSTSDLLPADTEVQWSTPIIAKAHEAARQGKLNEWLVQNRAGVLSLIGARYE